MLNNCNIVERRYKSLRRQLAKNKDLEQQYKSEINKLINNGDIEFVNKTILEASDPKRHINYLPKLVVERQDKITSKIRLSVQKSLLENNVGDENVLEEDDEVEEEEDAEEIAAADVQELEDDKTDEYHRLHNLLVRTRVDIRARKEKVEHLLKEDSNPLLTDSEKRSNDIRIKSQLRGISEQINTFKVYNNFIPKVPYSNLFYQATKWKIAA